MSTAGPMSLSGAAGGGAVLVLTHPFDPTADGVVEELNARQVEVFRCDPGQFPSALNLTSRLGAEPRGTLRLGDRTLDLGRVRCAYYRRPTRFAFDPEMSPAEQAWALGEARMGFGGVVSLLPRWLNHPFAIAGAEYKPVQLAAAHAAGLTVPATLVTNEPREARAFAREYGPVVVKSFTSAPLSDGTSTAMTFTTAVDPDTIDVSVSRTAHLFQALVPKEYEVRVTVVDGVPYAARIDAHSAAARLDWRSDYDHVSYAPVDTPDTITDGIAALMKHLDLRFGALDFVVTPAGEWVFLEVNPNGQWAWIEDACGLPITAALADALVRDALVDVT